MFIFSLDNQILIRRVNRQINQVLDLLLINYVTDLFHHVLCNQRSNFYECCIDFDGSKLHISSSYESSYGKVVDGYPLSLIATTNTTSSSSKGYAIVIKILISFQPGYFTYHNNPNNHSIYYDYVEGILIPAVSSHHFDSVL